MVFHSLGFIFLFLPIVFFGYFSLNRINHTAAKLFLLSSSIFFYAWWNPKYLPLLIASILFNFGIGKWLSYPNTPLKRKLILALGIAGNLGVLGYYKYVDFFIHNLNFVLTDKIPYLNIALPLAISFFTFQQIAYVVDSYRGETGRYRLLDYSLFITVFPHLVAGPITHHGEMVSQFENPKNKFWNSENIARGLFIFSIGLYKKVILADTFAKWADYGYAHVGNLSFFDAWLTSLSYTFQLYFDFSGYSDMAIGLALLFNIKLPANFNSPYKATSIQDFWRRWHITLSRFFTRYVYIPLGGSERGFVRVCVNVFIVFFLSGLWHGAGWTFIAWGVLHGVAMIVQRFWQKTKITIPTWLGWFLTFQFINVTWVFFRSPSIHHAIAMLQQMAGMSGFGAPERAYFQYTIPVWGKSIEHFFDLSFLQQLGFTSHISLFQNSLGYALASILVGFVVSLGMRNSISYFEQFKPRWWTAVVVAFMCSYALLNLGKISVFLYFNF